MKQYRNELTDSLAQYIFMLMEGDTHMIEDMYSLLQEAGYADEDGFEICEEEDEEVCYNKNKKKKK